MPKPTVYKIDDLDSLNYDNINLAKPFKDINNSYFSEITSEKILIQTSVLKNTSAIYNYNNSLYIDIKLNENQLGNYIAKVDTALRDKVCTNFFSWFSKRVSEKHIEEFYINSVVENQAEKPYVTFEIPTYNNVEDIIVYNKKNEKINIDKIEENMDMVLIMVAKGVRLERNKIYTVWEIQQMKLYYNEKNVYNDYLIEDDLDSLYDIENIPQPLDEEILSNNIINIDNAGEGNEVEGLNGGVKVEGLNGVVKVEGLSGEVKVEGLSGEVEGLSGEVEELSGDFEELNVKLEELNGGLEELSDDSGEFDTKSNSDVTEMVDANWKNELSEVDKVEIINSINYNNFNGNTNKIDDDNSDVNSADNSDDDNMTIFES